MDHSKRHIDPGPLGLMRTNFHVLDDQLSSFIRAIIAWGKQYFDSLVLRVNLMIHMFLEKTILVFQCLPTIGWSEPVVNVCLWDITVMLNGSSIISIDEPHSIFANIRYYPRKVVDILEIVAQIKSSDLELLTVIKFLKALHQVFNLKSNINKQITLLLELTSKIRTINVTF